jgi:hypothetical protein
MGFSVTNKELLDQPTEQTLSKIMLFLREFLLREHNEDGTHITASPTTDVASASAAYVTIGNTSNLAAERALVGAGSQVVITDNGPNSTVQVGLVANPLISGLTASRLVAGDGSKLLTSVPNLTSWIAGTTNQITSSDDGDGTLTLSLAANPLVSGLTASRLVSADGSKQLASVATLSSWVAGTSNQITVSDDGDGSITLSTPQNIATSSTPQFTALQLGGASGAATSLRQVTKKVTGIADNTATDILTVTVPNGNHAACVRLQLLSSNGSTDAFESSRCAVGQVVVARTTGLNAVATAATLTLTAIATVAAGATHTLAYDLSSISGAVGATNTFTIRVTIDDSGNLGSNQVVVFAELLNAEATGVTIA